MSGSPGMRRLAETERREDQSGSCAVRSCRWSRRLAGWARNHARGVCSALRIRLPIPDIRRHTVTESLATHTLREFGMNSGPGIQRGNALPTCLRNCTRSRFERVLKICMFLIATHSLNVLLRLQVPDFVVTALECSLSPKQSF